MQSAHLGAIRVASPDTRQVKQAARGPVDGSSKRSPHSAVGTIPSSERVLVLARIPAPLRLRHFAHALVEAPAMALQIERLVGPVAPELIAQPVGDAGAGGQRALVVRVDVVDVHTDVLALDPGALRADRAVAALPSDADHAVVAELHHRVADRA